MLGEHMWWSQYLCGTRRVPSTTDELGTAERGYCIGAPHTLWGACVIVVSSFCVAEHLPKYVCSYLTCEVVVDAQGVSSSSVSSTFGRIHWVLFDFAVLKMWSRSAVRIAHPQA